MKAPALYRESPVICRLAVDAASIERLQPAHARLRNRLDDDLPLVAPPSRFQFSDGLRWNASIAVKAHVTGPVGFWGFLGRRLSPRLIFEGSVSSKAGSIQLRYERFQRLLHKVVERHSDTSLIINRS